MFKHIEFVIEAVVELFGIFFHFRSFDISSPRSLIDDFSTIFALPTLTVQVVSSPVFLPKITSEVLLSFAISRFEAINFKMLDASFSSAEIVLVILFSMHEAVMSSAKPSITALIVHSLMSAMRMMNMIGDKQEPCGAPISMVSVNDL